jgi:hypothetical protein
MVDAAHRSLCDDGGDAGSSFDPLEATRPGVSDPETPASEAKDEAASSDPIDHESAIKQAVLDDAKDARPNVPAFAKYFPKDEALDAVLLAFINGDYARVREEATRLAAKTTDDEVKRAALELRSRTNADPMAKVFFLVAFALLFFLTVWWMAHDGSAQGVAPSPNNASEAK